MLFVLRRVLFELFKRENIDTDTPGPSRESEGCSIFCKELVDLRDA
jgi:hypothetical protein